MNRASLLPPLLRAVVLVCAVSLFAPFGGALPAHGNEGGQGEAPDQPIQPVGKAGPQKPKARPAAANVKPATAGKVQRKAVVRQANAPKPRPRRNRESAPSGMPRDGESRFVEDQVIVRYRLDARQADMDALVRRLNLRHLEGRTFRLAGITAHLYAVAGGSAIGEVIAALEASPTVVFAQPNYLYTLMQTAGGRAQGPQYALDKLAIFSAHALATGEGVSVAVIDSQIDSSHLEFEKTLIDVFDATGGAPGVAHAHGTSIAGIVASRGTLLGVAPNVRLVGIRAFLEDAGSTSAFSTTWRISASLDQAHASAARIVNMSFAGPEDPLVGLGVAGGARQGMIGIAAAGNDGPDARPLYPAAYPGIIAVTAIDKEDLIYSQANNGAHIALAAPGVDILAPAPGNGYQVTSGTSLAAAHVSGLAALLLSLDPTLTAADVADILFSSAADLGAPGRDAVFGLGLPDALSAIKASASRKAK